MKSRGIRTSSASRSSISLAWTKIPIGSCRSVWTWKTVTSVDSLFFRSISFRLGIGLIGIERSPNEKLQGKRIFLLPSLKGRGVRKPTVVQGRNHSAMSRHCPCAHGKHSNDRLLQLRSFASLPHSQVRSLYEVESDLPSL